MNQGILTINGIWVHRYCLGYGVFFTITPRPYMGNGSKKSKGSNYIGLPLHGIVSEKLNIFLSIRGYTEQNWRLKIIICNPTEIL